MKKDIMNIFNLQGLIVDKVTYEEDKIIIHVRHPQRGALCPHCERTTGKVHQRTHRKILHDVFNDRSIILDILVRRFMCKRCRRVFTERHLPGVSKSKFSDHLKAKIVRDSTQSSMDTVAKRYHLSSPSVMAILKDYNLNTEVPLGELRLNIDGHSFSGRDMKTTIGEILNKELLAVLPDASKASLVKYLNSLENSVKQRITEVCIDMDTGYKFAIEEALPNTRIVIDHFHVIKLLLQRMDKIRKILQGDSKRGYRRINRFLLLKNKENLTKTETLQLKELFSAYEKFPALQGMWWVKERIRKMYQCEHRKEAEKIFKQILLQLEEYEVGVMAETRRTLIRWKPYILNFFYNRTTNAFAEGCNNKIKVVKRMSYGFRNFDNYVVKIMLAFLPFSVVGVSQWIL